MLNCDAIAWDRMGGLVPAIVQDAFDGRVLMQAYMNREALEATLDSGRVTFWSRSRETLWTKGETSGHYLDLVAIHPDCDGDSLLVLARPLGPACHLGTDTCFEGDGAASPELAFLATLAAVITDRNKDRSRQSYTSQLFESGVKRICQKVGEEAVETAIAGASGDDEALVREAADLFYHLLVLLEARGLGLRNLLAELGSRHNQPVSTPPAA